MIDAIILRRGILEWRDECLGDADITLTRLLCDLQGLVADELGKAVTWRLAAFPAQFCETVIDPVVARRMHRAMSGLQERADKALRPIRDDALTMATQSTPRLLAARDVMKTALDVGSVGAPMVLGAWAVVAVPALGVGSATAALGLATVATFSMPILVGGVVVAAAATSVGLTRFGGLSKRISGRVKDQLDQALTLAILGEGSALTTFSAEIERITDMVLKELDDAATATV